MEQTEKLAGIKDTHFCPNCKSNNQVDYERYYREDENTNRIFVVGRCHLCDKVFIFTYKHPKVDPNQPIPFQGINIGGYVKVELESAYPISIPEISKDVPKKIAETYEEGIMCLNVNAPNGAVSVFRRTLQKICIDKGAKEGDKLADQISILPKELEQEAVELKQWGNLGAHPDKNIKDVPMPDAKEMQGFLERVIYVTYEVPAKLSQSRKNRGK